MKRSSLWDTVGLQSLLDYSDAFPGAPAPSGSGPGREEASSEAEGADGLGSRGAGDDAPTDDGDAVQHAAAGREEGAR